jgi:hypothetical protein
VDFPTIQTLVPPANNKSWWSMRADGVGKARKPPKSRLHVPTFGRAKGLGEAVSKNPGENGQRKALCRRHF